MAGWKEILLDMLKLTDEVKQLNQQTEKIAERTIEIDRRVVRLETIIEIKETKK